MMAAETILFAGLCATCQRMRMIHSALIQVEYSLDPLNTVLLSPAHVSSYHKACRLMII